MDPQSRYVHVRLWQLHIIRDTRCHPCAERCCSSTFPPCFKQVRDLGSGSFGVAQLMRVTATGELVAVKKLERGPTVTLRLFA
jgi:hypothetical protein